MNASPVSASGSPLASREAVAPKVRKRRSWVVSLTGVCFLFGGLLAMQLRAIQQVQDNRQREKKGQLVAAGLVKEMRIKAEKAEKERVEAQKDRDKLKNALLSSGKLTSTQIAALTSQIKDLETVAGLTSIKGPGVRITLADNPNAAKDSGETAFLPGLVHDYDVLQVVNELRAAKADAIAVRGAGGETVRVTGYTPIRCVGPVIYINWEPVAAPFTIEAVGEPKTLRSALEMANGIVDNLKNNGAIDVKVAQVEEMVLPQSSTGAPKFSVAKSGA